MCHMSSAIKALSVSFMPLRQSITRRNNALICCLGYTLRWALFQRHLSTGHALFVVQHEALVKDPISLALLIERDSSRATSHSAFQVLRQHWPVAVVVLVPTYESGSEVFKDEWRGLSQGITGLLSCRHDFFPCVVKPLKVQPVASLATDAVSS